MSTYLVAMVVGYFDFIEAKSKEGIPVRIYTPLQKKDQATFALQLTTKTLSFFADYLGVPYALPKLDSIAVFDTKCSMYSTFYYLEDSDRSGNVKILFRGHGEFWSDRVQRGSAFGR